MNPENKIRKDLLSKRRRDLHIRFFQQNPSLSSVKVPILSPIDSTKCLVPFRNTNCTEPDCVHDLQDLINMCKSFNYKFPKGFNCRACNMYIEFKNFFLDEYLKNIIDSIWESHNSDNKVVYDSIIIRRNGSWQPVPSGKSANLNSNSIDQPQMMTNRTSDTKKYGQTRTSLEYTTMTTWRDDRTVTEGEKPVTIVNYENPPHLCEYNQVEYEQLLSAFERGSIEDSVILRRDDAIVTRDDLKKLEHDEIVTSQTMSMFVWYLNVLQKVHGKIYNKKNNCYVTAFKVCSFDQFKKQVRYNTISSSLEFQGKHHEACNTYDKITILLSIEQRWVVAVLDLIERRLVLVDFLQDDLSRMKAPEMLEIIKYLVRAEFQFTYNEVKLYDVPKLSFISDCGLYALSFVYKCISNPVLDNIRIKFYEKELFRKQIVWLLLKMRTLKKTEVHLFMAPENNSRETISKTSAFTRQTFEDSLLMRMPSIPSDQVSTLPRFHAKSCNNLLPEALAATRARVNSKNNLKTMLDVKPASDSEAIVRPERAKPVSNLPQFNLGVNNKQVVSHWNLREESNSLNSLRAKRGSMLLQGDYKRSLQDLDKPRSQDNSLLKPKPTRTQEIKEKIMTKRKQVMSLNNLDAIETSDIKRKDLQSILSDFKKDILDAIKQEHEAQRKPETNRISLLNRESESRKAFPPLRHDYKSLSELMDEDLPDPRLFMPRKQGNIGFIGLPKNHLASDDESLGGSDDEDDIEDSEESSPSIVLFGFQEENESPKRLDLEAKEESDKKQQRVEEGGYDGFKKGLEKEYNEEEEGGLFDYSPDIVKSVAISEKRQGANEYNRDLHEIREHGHDEEESPF